MLSASGGNSLATTMSGVSRCVLAAAFTSAPASMRAYAASNCCSSMASDRGVKPRGAPFSMPAPWANRNSMAASLIALHRAHERRQAVAVGPIDSRPVLD